MLESFINFRLASKKPWLVSVWAFIVSSIAIFFSTQIYSRIQVSGVSISMSGAFAALFTIIPSVYFVTLLIKREEKLEEEEISNHYKKGFFERHERDILIFLFYFLGLTLSFAVWSLVLEPSFFQIQLSTICSINPSFCNSPGLTGAVTGLASRTAASSFLTYLTNNLQVTIFAFIFSIVFGAGAVFIIVWNASILGVAIGSLSKTIMEIPLYGLSYLPHGLPEIAGYICAGLAGGILSAAIIRGHHKRGVFRTIVFDSMKILILGIFLIILGAGIEAWLPAFLK